MNQSKFLCVVLIIIAPVSMHLFVANDNVHDVSTKNEMKSNKIEEKCAKAKLKLLINRTFM